MKFFRTPRVTLPATVNMDSIDASSSHETFILETSTDHGDRSLMLGNLAWWLLHRFEHSRAITVLESAIRATEEAVERLAPMNPNGSAVRTLLGLLFLRHFEHFNGLDHLDKSIVAIQNAIMDLSGQHRDASVLWIILRTVLIKRFNQHKPEVVRTTSHQMTIAFLRAFKHSVRFIEMVRQTGHPDNFDQAMYNSATVVASSVPNLYLWWYQFGVVDYLENAFQVCVESLIVPPLHWWVVESVLLYRRYTKFGDGDDLARAVRASERAIAATPSGHSERLLALYSMGTVFTHRFTEFGESKDLATAIRAILEGLATIPISDFSRPFRLCTLSEVLAIRYSCSRSEEDIENAITPNEEAVAATPAGYFFLPGRLAKLADCYRIRFLNSGATEDLCRAVDAIERAFRIPRVNNGIQARVLHQRDMVLHARFLHSGDLEDLTNAIRMSEEAVAATPLGGRSGTPGRRVQHPISSVWSTQ